MSLLFCFYQVPLSCRPQPGELNVVGEKLAGAEGFEPSPSSLTVRCPTGWTTPQRARPQGGQKKHHPQGRLRRKKRAAKGSSKIARRRISGNEEQREIA